MTIPTIVPEVFKHVYIAGWTVPVAASIGGVLLLVVVIIVVIMCRRSKKPHNMSPIDEQVGILEIHYNN
jgi:hypothetical protein